jgi:hypothetical protein
LCKKMCPCCTAHLLRQIRRTGIYWFCQHCREERPILKTQTNLSITPKIEEKNYLANRSFLGTTIGKTEGRLKEMLKNLEENMSSQFMNFQKLVAVSLTSTKTLLSRVLPGRLVNCKVTGRATSRT